MPRSDPQAAEEGIDGVALAAFCAMAICMALSFVFVKISLEGFSLAQAAGGRMVLGAALLVPLAYLFGDGLPFERWFVKWCVILGIFNFVLPFTLTTWGQLHLPSNVAGAMFSFIPLVTIGLSAVLLRVRITGRKITGLGIGFLGLVALSEPAKWVGTTGMAHALPMLSVFGAVLCFGVAAILMRVMPRVHPFSLMGGAALFSAIFGILPFLSVFDGDLPPLRPWVGLLGVSVLSTTIAYSLRFFLIRRKGPVYLAPNAYIGAVLVNVFGVAVLGESIGGAMMIALPLIVVGLVTAQDGSGRMEQV